MNLQIDVHLHDSHGAATMRRIEEMFHLIFNQGAKIMSAQDDIDTATKAIDAKVTALESANAATIAELVVIKGLLDAAVKQTPPDLSALNHIGDRIDALTGADTAATAANAP